MKRYPLIKILFFIDSLAAGGKERRLTELLKGLSNIEYINFELAVLSDEIHYEEVNHLGILIHKIIRKNKKDINVFKKVYRLIKNCKPDIVHSWDSMSTVYVVPSCKLLNIRIINGMVVDTPQKRNIFNKYYFRARITFPFCDYIVGNSESGLNAYKAPAGKRVKIHNGFDFKRLNDIQPAELIRQELNISSERIIGMVASFSEKKDYRTFYKAAQMILSERKDTIFIAIGRDTDSEESMELIDQRYMNNFRLIGKRTNIESFINVMDICVLSTFTEGISNSIMEYMALGKPVVATSGSGTDEIVLDKKTGFLVKQSDPDDLAEKLKILLANDKLRNEMGKNGRERIKQEFSIGRMINMYISLYCKPIVPN